MRKPIEKEPFRPRGSFLIKLISNSMKSSQVNPDGFSIEFLIE